MSFETTRLSILDQIEAGQISAAEGLRQLEALNRGEPAAPAAPPTPAATAAPVAPDLGHWRRWWVLPLTVGLAITLAGAGLLYWTLRAADFRLSVWFFLALVPFGFGVLLTALAAASRGARWIHIRVHTGADEGPRRIALSFPLPIRLTAWALRTFGGRIPHLQKTGVDELILALGDATSPHNPLYVEVDQGRNGEKVQVYIG